MRENLFYNDKYSSYISAFPYFSVEAESEEELKEKLVSRAVSFINLYELGVDIKLDYVEWQKKFAVKKGEELLSIISKEVAKTTDKKSYKNMSNVFVQTLFSFKCLIDGAVIETDGYYFRAIEEINKTLTVKGGFMECGFNALDICDSLPLAEGYEKLFTINSRLIDLAYKIYKEFLSSGIKCDNQFKFE